MDPAPKILFITRCGFGTGGMQTFSKGLQQFFLEHDVSVSVLSYRGPKFLLPIFYLRALLAGFLFSGQRVHLADGALAPVGLLLSWICPKLRLSITVHGLDVIYQFYAYQWMIRRSLLAFDSIVAVSNATKAEVEKRGIPASRIVIIPPGISLPHAVPRTPVSELRILLLGRQIRRKGTRWFLSQVLPSLTQLHPSLRVTVAGSGPELASIRLLVQEKNLQGMVQILGLVTDREREKLFESSTHFLMPNIHVASDMEGFGLACIEAASRGLQVIASAREGIINAVIEGETGFLFVPEDSDSCIKAIERSLSHPLDSIDLRRRIEEHFSLEHIGTMYLSYVFSAS